MTKQKHIAMALDRAAERCHQIEIEPATSKQCWFLAKLIAEAGGEAADVDCAITNSSALLSRKMASTYIDSYLAAAKRAGAAA